MTKQHQGAIHQPREVVQRAPGVIVVPPDHLFGGRQGERTSENSQGAKDPPFPLREEVVAPIERPAQGSLAVRFTAPPPGEESKALVQSLRDLLK